MSALTAFDHSYDASSVDALHRQYSVPLSMAYVLKRGAVDHRYWCRFWLGWDPHDGQVAWGENEAQESYLVTGRRAGKSTGQAAKMLRRMFHREETEHLNCSITMDQAKIVTDVAASMAMSSPRFQGLVTSYSHSPFPCLELTNHSRLWARSTQRRGQFIRGHSYHSVNYDEIAWGMLLDLEVLFPCLLDYGGPFSGTTSPRGQGWFYQQVKRVMEARERETALMGFSSEQARRLSSYYFQRGPSTDNPIITFEEVERQRRMLSPKSFAQEVMGEFVPMENALFTEDDVSRVPVGIRDDDLELEQEEPEAEGVYVSGWDLGRKKSWAVGITLRVDCRPWRGVSRVRLHKCEWPDIADAYVKETLTWRARPLVDETGVGDAFIGLVKPRRVPVEGFMFNAKSKQELLEGLQMAVQERRVVIPPWMELIEQMPLYTWDGSDDSDETYDDLMAFALAVEQAKRTPAAGRPIVTGARRNLTVLGGQGPHRARLKDDRFKGWER